MSGFTGLMVEKVQQLHRVVIIVNFSGKCINFVVLCVEMCFQTFDFNLSGSSRKPGAGGDVFSQQRVVVHDPVSEFRPIHCGKPWRWNSSLYIFILGLIWKLYKSHWICLNNFVGESGYTSLQDGLTYEDIQVGYLFNAFVMQYIFNFHEWMHESF